MNEFEKQILTNQRELLFSSMTKESDPQQKERLRQCEVDTETLLNPEVEPTLAERTHDALSEENEVKKE